jgi:hypothetical protein
MSTQGISEEEKERRDSHSQGGRAELPPRYPPPLLRKPRPLPPPLKPRKPDGPAANFVLFLVFLSPGMVLSSLEVSISFVCFYEGRGVRIRVATRCPATGFYENQNKGGWHGYQMGPGIPCGPPNLPAALPNYICYLITGAFVQSFKKLWFLIGPKGPQRDLAPQTRAPVLLSFCSFVEIL